MPHLARSTWIAMFAIVTTAGAAAAQPTVEYDWSGGGIRGIPLAPGRSYTLEIENLNTLCYAYQAEFTVRDANVNLASMTTALGYKASTTPTDGAPPAIVPPPAPPPPPPPPPPPGVPLVDGGKRRVTVEEARMAVAQAEAAIAELTAARRGVANVVQRVEQPVCSGRSSVQPLLNDWDALRDERREVANWSPSLTTASRLTSNAADLVADLDDGAAKDDLELDVETAGATVKELATQLPALAGRLAGAGGRIETARNGQVAPSTVFIPAGATGAELTIRATELNPGEGRTAAVVESKVPLALRKGMRIFLSVGALAGTGRAHDYARVNRVYGDTVAGKRDSTYSTYVNRAPGRGIGFSPVLQTNVAFPEIFSSGVSMHGSLGVASRSVNGRVSPEFIFGVGTGFLDHFLVTVGYHLSRDETLLLGNAAEVAQRPVPTTVTDSDAVSEIWRSSMAMTVTLKL